MHRKDLTGQAYLFKVQSILQLPAPSPLRLHCSNRHKGQSVELQTNHPRALVQNLSTHAHLPAWMQADNAPTGALRFPEPYARLIANGRWQSFVLPSFTGARGQSCRINWSILDVPIRDLPVLPAHMPRETAGDVALTRGVAIRAADHLRRYASSMDPTDDFTRDMLIDVIMCIAALDNQSESLQAEAFVRAVKIGKATLFMIIEGSIFPPSFTQ